MKILIKIKKREAISSNKANEKDGFHEVPWYSPNPLARHPHINNRGYPPKLDASNFGQWQYQMAYHVCGSLIEPWRIIENGFKVVDPTNLTRRDVVDSQRNATALHMI
jgi:hypothetical protein